jgi:biotin operon repressor
MASRPFASLDAPRVVVSDSSTVAVVAALGRGPRALYAFLKNLARRRPVVCPSQETLAKKLGCTDRSIRTYLNLLRTAGLIQILSRGRRRTPEYRVTPEEPPKPTEASRAPKLTKTGETKLKETVSDRKIFPPKGSTTRSKYYMDLITRGRARGAERADEIPAAEAAARRAAAEEILAVRAQLCELGACAAIANPAAYRATLVKKDAETLGGDLERNRAWLAQVRAERTPRPDAGAYAPPAPTAAEAAWETTPAAERKPWLRRALASLRAAGMWAQVGEGFAHLADFKRFRREFLTRQARELFCAAADAPAADTPGPEAVTPHSAAGASGAPPGRTWEATPPTARKAWLRRAFESLRASGMWTEICDGFREMPNFGRWRRDFLTQQAKELFCAAADAPAADTPGDRPPSESEPPGPEALTPHSGAGASDSENDCGKLGGLP